MAIVVSTQKTNNNNNKKSFYEEFSDEDCDEEQSCGICGDVYDSKGENYIKLKCGHEYCYTCISEYFKMLDLKSKEYKYSSTSTNLKRECPYCRAPAALLPLKMGVKYIKGVHRAPIKKKYTDRKQCIAICKSGHQCKKYAKEGNNGYCSLHNEENSNLCCKKIVISQNNSTKVQCLGICKSGLQCKRYGKAEFNGYCSQHKDQFKG